MAITLATNARNAVCDAIVDLVDVGTTDTAGDIEIATTGFASSLAVVPLVVPAYSSSASGVATLLSVPRSVAAVASGTAAVWRLRDRNNVQIMQGNVSLTADGSDITLASIAQNAGLNALNTLIGASGVIQITTAADTGFAAVLVTLPLNATAFAAASAGNMTMNVSPAPTANATAAGTAGLFRFCTSGLTEVFRGTVGVSASDINFSTGNVFGVGTPVTLSSYTHSMAATSAASVGVLVITSLTLTAGQNCDVTSSTFTQPA
jgi:hypothetical protein